MLELLSPSNCVSLPSRFSFGHKIKISCPFSSLLQVIFHTATLMPNHPTDPKANKKKRHIGNDYVAIVYNNSGGEYKLGTVKGQFIYACVVVIPLEEGSNKVFIECRPELEEPLGHVRVRHKREGSCKG